MTEENNAKLATLKKPVPVRLMMRLQSTTLVLPANLAVQVIEAIAAQEGYSLEPRWSADGNMNVIHEKVELEVWTATDHAKAVMDTATSREK